ncbi:hypothetical protein ACG7TL_003229 [Trametes sanguinea]
MSLTRRTRLMDLGKSSEEGTTGEKVGENTPGRSLANPYPRPGKVLSQPLIVLRKPAELELGHGLLVGTRVHGWRRWAGEELPRGLGFRANKQGKGMKGTKGGGDKDDLKGWWKGRVGGWKGLDAVVDDEDGEEEEEDEERKGEDSRASGGSKERWRREHWQRSGLDRRRSLTGVSR